MRPLNIALGGHDYLKESSADGIATDSPISTMSHVLNLINPRYKLSDVMRLVGSLSE
ncbi:hypothetical protein BSAE_1756 [Bifidobacterium pullorum subsp. saeculare DSM 6531 = LMG 14934]|uniref:Uncharacterized protein n=1 Tax=Bifidobacterium pullorum subsp. saeculare DSM 6531 = LMG 14934 TaxID=1437611 RepID=A0A087CXX1_9BIFI|nr:hypothetical protein BSAE_1756 [Bifidobacterium pullorum subsp. saeculare DSM 6531 = LMG 14934]